MARIIVDYKEPITAIQASEMVLRVLEMGNSARFDEGITDFNVAVVTRELTPAKTVLFRVYPRGK